MRSLLAGLTPSDIRLDPFPHIVAADCLDPSLYTALSESFPSFARMVGSAAQVPNNRRYQLSAEAVLQASDMPDCWRVFLAYHSRPEFLQEVGALFEGHWPRPLLEAVEGRWDGHSCQRLDYGTPMQARIRQDARFEINTPVSGVPSSPRGAHLDTANRLFSGLFYLRAAEDDSIGGELLLYRWRKEPEVINRFEFSPREVEIAAVIPYRPNQLVIFPQSIDALHGVGVRGLTPHMRRYVFITAELENDWLFPRAGG